MARSFSWGASQRPARQLDALQAIVTKHVTDPALMGLVGTDDFTLTTTERGFQRFEHPHLATALDVLCTYQRDRRASSVVSVFGHRPRMRRQFQDDPRTRIIELLKRWLRTRAGSATIDEEDVRGMCSLCRDILNHPSLFPARNPRSFLRTMADVYEHLQWQLRDVLEHDRTCAELAQRALSLSRNLLSDAIGYLLLAPTDLRQTDALPSLEVVALWQSLPDDGHPLPGRIDSTLQRTMNDAWRTRCGSLIAAVLSTPWCVRLFDGAHAAEEAAATVAAITEGTNEEQNHNEAPPTGSGTAVLALIAEAAAEFERGHFKGSGLAGAFRTVGQNSARQAYLTAIEVVFDLMYLLGEVLVQFHRISDGLGDYGMIRVAPWLHPFLDALAEKVQRLKTNLERVNQEFDGKYVLARARNVTVEKPAPSDRMCARAHSSIERAVTSGDSHAHLLLQVVEELKSKSAPERLPHVMEGLGNACMSLQNVLMSPDFRARVGDAFPDLPPLSNVAMTTLDKTVADQNTIPQLADAPALYHDEGAKLPHGESHGAGVTTTPQQHLDMNCIRSKNDGCNDNPKLLGSNSEAIRIRKAIEPPCTGNIDTSNLRSVCELRAEVHRMACTRNGNGLRRHDRRSLMLSGGRLYIFSVGSNTQLKAVVDIQKDLQDFTLARGCVLQFTVLRVPHGALAEDGVTEHKQYAFEFPSSSLLQTFCDEFSAFGVPQIMN